MLTARTSVHPAFVLLFAALFCFPVLAQSLDHGPTWAKAALGFCNPTFDKTCKSRRIVAPNGSTTLRITYRGHQGTFTIEEKSHSPLRIPMPYGASELQWSPDSQKFFVNGDRGGGYWGFFTYVYDLRQKRVAAIDLAAAAQRDMVRLFPPCRDESLDRKTCTEMERDPEYNMSTIAWTPDSTAVIVFAEIPFAGSYGSGIMCQVMGYQLSVPSGKIIRRIDAQSLKHEFQKDMAWNMTIPDPPDYSWPPKKNQTH